MDILKENFDIKWHHINFMRSLRPFEFMNMTQECAGKHAEILGFGYDDLIKFDQAWVLGRIKIVFKSSPMWGDSVNLHTWHKGKNSLFWLRDFILYSQTGEELIVATSSWIIMNLKTRRIERSTHIENVYNESKSLSPKDAIKKPCDKLVAWGEPKCVGNYSVSYSDVDFYKHANNAKYIEWIMDFIPITFLQDMIIKEIQINYILEAKLGDKISFYMSERECDNGQMEFYIAGKRGEELIFQSQLLLEKK